MKRLNFPFPFPYVNPPSPGPSSCPQRKTRRGRPQPPTLFRAPPHPHPPPSLPQIGETGPLGQRGPTSGAQARPPVDPSYPIPKEGTPEGAEGPRRCSATPHEPPSPPTKIIAPIRRIPAPRSSRSNVGIPYRGSLRWTLHIVYRRREHRRGPKAPDVVPRSPTSPPITIIAPMPPSPGQRGPTSGSPFRGIPTVDPSCRIFCPLGRRPPSPTHRGRPAEDGPDRCGYPPKKKRRDPPVPALFFPGPPKETQGPRNP